MKRCHRPTDGSAVGLTLVPGLVSAAEERGIPLRMKCEAKELIVNDGAVEGVLVDEGGKSKKLNAHAVILASGGLGANQEMVTKYRPDLAGYVTTNQPGATRRRLRNGRSCRRRARADGSDPDSSDRRAGNFDADRRGVAAVGPSW